MGFAPAVWVWTNPARGAPQELFAAVSTMAAKHEFFEQRAIIIVDYFDGDQLVDLPI
jgi:hypothetical protein